MQRLHEDDLTGHVLKQEPWEMAAFPAIAEDDEAHEVETLNGPHAFQRKAGEALDPAREPLAVLERVRAALGEQNFAAQYQQRPAPAGGGLIKTQWFRRYGERPLKFDRIVQSWDTANTAGEASDWSVCTTWGLNGSEFYLIDVLRKKLAYPDLKRAVTELDARFAPDVILIEDRASGTQLVQELIAAGCAHARRVSPQGDKVTRMQAESVTIENGFVFLPETAPWLADYLAEFLAFPKGRHDDQVDSTAQALAWAKPKRGNAEGWLEYYRRLEV